MTAKWKGPTKCTWPNCTSKATFKTRAALATHTGNIHITPLLCSVPECSYKKPFGKNYELRRHIQTAHENTQAHKCPFEDCESHISGFSRKDKLIKHTKEKHLLMRCPYNHCFAEVAEVETELHMERFHGDYECAIGSCGTKLNSRFRREELLTHLRSYHNMSYDAANNIQYKLTQTINKTAYASDTTGKWRDCNMCTWPLVATDENGKDPVRTSRGTRVNLTDPPPQIFSILPKIVGYLSLSMIASCYDGSLRNWI